MTASYPGSIRSFSTKRNTLDIIDASDPNGIQEEVVAIQRAIGVSPALSTAPSSSGSFASTATTFTNLTDRLANIEIGIVADTHIQYVKKSGNEIITNATASNVALTVTGASGQSANLQNWKNNSGTILANVNSSGVITASSISSPEIELQTIESFFGN